jgi:hypothetical protein
VQEDVAVIETTGVSPDAVKEDIEGIISQSETNKLSSKIKEETKFELDEEFAVGIELTTDDEELNEHDPRVVHLPLKPANDWDRLTPLFSDPSPAFSVDNGGAMLAATVEESGKRTLAGLMGITREESQGGFLVPYSTQTVDTKSFVVEDGTAKVHRESTGEQPLKAEFGKDQPTRMPSSDLTPTDIPDSSPFTCWGCATVVGVACAGAASLSYSTCVSAAFSSSAFSPFAGATVAAFCTYIVSNAGTLSCAAGTAAICAGVSRDCEFLEDEL